jgi:ArsR family transcriptional regulator, arsenate/arsenite/antimonite-responsive transcriptional repressor
MKIKKIKALGLERTTILHKALADDSRLRILALMFRFGEICISDLELILDFTQTKTSRHVTYLKHSGILSHLKREKWIYYFIKDEYKDFIAPVIDAIDQDEIVMKDLETYITLYSNNTLATRHLHNIQKRYNLPEL